MIRICHLMLCASSELYYIAIGLEANITLQSIIHAIQLLDVYRKIDFTIASE